MFADFDSRRKLLENLFKKRITKSNPVTGLVDIRGDELYMQAFAKIDDIIDRAIKAEKPLADLYDPTKDDYIGKQLENYVRTPQQIIKDMASQFGVDQGIPEGGSNDDTIKNLKKLLKDKFGINL